MHKFEVHGGLYAILAATIFLFIAVLHGLRAYYGLDLIIGTWTVPIWISWLVAFVGFIMAITAIQRL